MYSEQRENISVCVCVRHCLSTLDGDLGIGGGPPGLRVWLDASLPLSKQDREKEGEEKKTNYRESNEDGKRYEIKAPRLKKQLNAKTQDCKKGYKTCTARFQAESVRKAVMQEK